MRFFAHLILLLCVNIVHADEAIWLDVRTPQEFSEGHVEPAINIPFEQISNRISEVTSDKTSEIILYCRSGKRASIAMDALQTLGYENVKNVQTLSAANALFEQRAK